jgi:hypothetical protein
VKWKNNSDYFKNSLNDNDKVKKNAGDAESTLGRNLSNERQLALVESYSRRSQMA